MSERPVRWTRMQVVFVGVVLFASITFLISSRFLDVSFSFSRTRIFGLRGQRNSSWFNSMKKNAELHSVANRTGSFLVDTPKCKIPHIPIRNFTFWEDGFPQEDVCTILPNVTYVDYQDVVVNTAVLKELGYNLSSVSCCYRTILRATECVNMTALFYIHHSDNQFCVSNMCHPMNGVRTRPTSPFIFVICRRSSNYSTNTTSKKTSLKLFYKNFHMVAVLPSNNEQVQRKLFYWKSHANLPLNVMIIGLDATSRLNAHRNLPQSLQLLRDVGALEMRGYNKVGSNTLPCLTPLLSGHSLHELKALCLNGSSAATAAPIQILRPASVLGPFDECPWIWKEFSKNNYVTAYFEDDPNISIFNYLKKGFEKRPADVYSRPWMMAAYRHFRRRTNNTAGHCLGRVTTKQAILQEVVSLARLSQEGRWPLFSFAWMTHKLHERSLALGGMDVTLAKAITELNERRILENTLLLVMGDHGYHGPSRGQGWFEDRLPTLFVRLPERLVEQHPQVVRALQYNARQLLTTFDLHATLKDVMALGNQKNMTFSEKHEVPKRGLSLLRQLPDRTCEEGGISREFCTCGPLTVSRDMARDVARGAHFIVDYINAGLPRICHPLSLKHTLGYAEMGLPSPGTKKYILALELLPGDMVFEAMVTFHEKGAGLVPAPDMVYDLLRINSYNQSHIQCLNKNDTLKLMYEPFCYCKNHTVEFWKSALTSAF